MIQPSNSLRDFVKDDHWVGPESLTTDVDIQCTPAADFACNHNVYKLTNHFNS